MTSAPIRIFISSVQSEFAQERRAFISTTTFSTKHGLLRYADPLQVLDGKGAGVVLRHVAHQDRMASILPGP